jgi:hypothetical protein
MSDQEASGIQGAGVGTDAVHDQGTSGRLEQFVTGVHGLRVPNQSESLERRLYLAGIVLPALGLIVIWIGWWGASGTKYVYQEIPYIISGGIFGVALVLIGAALFARYSVARLLRFWLARLVAEQQIQTDRVVNVIGSLAEAVKGQAVVTDSLADRSGDHSRPLEPTSGTE